MPGPAPAQVSWHVQVSASDCQYPRLAASSGTQRARDLLVRKFLSGVRPPFRSVRDLGLVSSGCPGGSGAPEGCSSPWLPADDSVTLWSSSPSPVLFPATRPHPVLSQAPPPNPIAAEPDGRRVLSGGGAADHAVTPKAPLTGSGCREHSYGGFGGGHPHFGPACRWRLVPYRPVAPSISSRIRSA